MKPRKRGPTIPRTVVAQMRERFIFNFRLRPDALARHLPVRWLAPQIINGWSTVSFCILKLDRITIWPIPSIFNFSTISCAYRVGVLDLSGDEPEPSVYITDRNADLPIIIRTAPLLFADAIPALKSRMSSASGITTIELRYMDGQPLFSVQLSAAPALRSDVFTSIEEFAAFIKGGVSSYTPSVLPDTLARVDLHKEDIAYQPLDAKVEFSWLDGVWPEAGIEYDSAVFASGATYK
ncbi:MAG: hypothetical protein ACREOG_23915, partial [Gemmatimonadaceae bacterium]